ncbi:hypothetical protein LCGC14_1719410 [marine sediment metagenome]|uniref:Uncharacterized protein n=1 Tax=marine sediment metagenome TaxID=412755 RepID=A0A0F9KCR1_9ZZZZ
MAWIAPKSWSIGELVSAADLNEQIRDNMNHLKLIVNNSGKIPALSSTYFSNLSGTSLTGVAKLAANNDFSAGVQSFNAGAGTRLVLPTGADKWGT